MGFKFNPFSGNFDATGASDAAPFAGQVNAYTDLPLDSTAALNSRWLVKNNSGTWPFSTYKQAGIYIRVNTAGSSRDTDYQFVGTLPSVMNDNEFLIYDDADATRNLKFNVGANVPTASTVTLTAPGASGTLGWLQSVSSITVSTDHQLTAARNQRVRVNSTASGSGATVYLPSTGNAEGDRLEVACVGLTSGTLGVRTGQYDFTVSTSMGLNEQRTFIYTAGAWTLGSVESHTHAGLGPTFASSAFRVTEVSGIVTNQLAFSLSGLTAGSTRTLTVPDASGRIQVEGQPIGSTTPAAGTFTTLSATGDVTVPAGSGFTAGFGRWRDNAAGGFVASLSGVDKIRMLGSPDYFIFSATTELTWGGSGVGSVDLRFAREAAGTIAQRNGTAAQTFRLYGTFTTATNYQRMTVRSVKQTLSALSGASATTTGTFIPDGAVVVGVTTRVSTAITGATGYKVGDGTDADRWGDINAIALNTTSDNSNWTAGTIECFTAGGEITLTANTNNFTAGAVEICVFYLAGEAD